eukprot:575041-Amphidinium_carterae.1
MVCLQPAQGYTILDAFHAWLDVPECRLHETVFKWMTTTRALQPLKSLLGHGPLESGSLDPA